MPLGSGQMLGSYRVLEKLGEGGMGEVYRARDTRLDRDVALKILPDLFTSDPDRLARFEREAKMLASLNHPNVAQVFGFEQAGDMRAIAMELVEGPTLAELIDSRPAEAERVSSRLRDGASAAGRESLQPAAPGVGPRRPEESRAPRGLKLDDALPIARQIALALDAAHEQGIVHRDLKPANVKVKPDGTVKVLDFGLAKALVSEATSASGTIANSPTLTARATEMGMILGTAAYMAPEQAKGRPVDRRADIWAFGVVLFEMLAGRRAFEGDDVSEVLASVLKLEPNWPALPADLPPPVTRLLRRCLEKDPKRRLRDVAEGMLQLDEALAEAAATPERTAAAAPPPAVVPPPLWRRLLPVAAAVVVTAAAMATLAWLGETEEPDPPLVRFSYTVPPTLATPLITASMPDLAVFPDGRGVVFLGVPAGSSGIALYMRRHDALEAVPVPGAGNGLGPFVSPDGEWIGFFEQGSPEVIRKVRVGGGAPMTVARAASAVFGAAWTGQGSIVFGVFGNGLFQVSDTGGEPVSVTVPDTSLNEAHHLWPAAIPGTTLVLFVTSPSSSVSLTGKLAVVDLSDGQIVRFDLSGTYPRWSPSGHVVYAGSDGRLRAVRFDLKRRALVGAPAPVPEQVATKLGGAASFDVGLDGQLVYLGGGDATTRTLSWVDRAGRDTSISAPPRAYFYARVSPDGTRLSLDVRDAEQDIWIWDIRRSVLSRLTDKPGSDQYGLWTPDGASVVFASEDGLYRQRADGTGAPERLTTREGGQSLSFPNAVSPDGRVIFRRPVSGGSANDLFAVSLDGDRAITPVLTTVHDELNVALSPDGRWMAYESNLSGRHEIYVRPFPDTGAGHWTISNAGGTEPVWARAGTELFYLAPDNRLMVVPIDTAKGFVPGVPAPLFDTRPYFFGGLGRNYDVAPDGKRFVMVKNQADASAGSVPMVFVLNWARHLGDVVR